MDRRNRRPTCKRAGPRWLGIGNLDKTSAAAWLMWGRRKRLPHSRLESAEAATAYQKPGYARQLGRG